MFKAFFIKETEYFNKLHQDARILITTIFLYYLINPLFTIFLDAFLWRKSHDIMLIATYNVILFAAIPFGFYLNGLFLRKFSPVIPYTFSLITAGLAVAILMFLPKITYPLVIIISIMYGISAGVYWGVRNLLTLMTTTTHDRIYFSSIEIASNNVTGVLFPLLIGWFIIFGSTVHLYTPLQGYQFLVIYMLAIIILIGIIGKRIHKQKIIIPTLLVKQASAKWQKFRYIEFILGLKEAIVTFVPVLLVLTLVGKEAALGTVQSFSAILGSILIYTLGKKLGTQHRINLIAISVLIAVLGAVLFGILYSAIGVLIFFASQALSEPFIWVSSQSINYDLIDMDNKDPNQHYAYVCDQEIYLNGGRVVGILLFMLLLFLTSNTFALRFAPLVFASTQIFLLILAYTIEKNQNKH